MPYKNNEPCSTYRNNPIVTHAFVHEGKPGKHSMLAWRPAPALVLPRPRACFLLKAVKSPRF